MSNSTHGLFFFGPYRLDAGSRVLTRSGVPVTLAPKTFDLLVVLVESGGRLLTKSELMLAFGTALKLLKKREKVAILLISLGN